nr:MAG TPA: hypothetical protein [Caudoviricetes sp.]DAS50120.1 MAG TPA: hypothetical protein [Caudoviricetes sp.]
MIYKNASIPIRRKKLTVNIKCTLKENKFLWR